MITCIFLLYTKSTVVKCNDFSSYILWFPSFFSDSQVFLFCKSELQVPGGRTEAETAGAIPISTKATIPTLPRATSVSSNDAPASRRASVPPANEEEQGKKYLLKWKGPKKINRIYGDWLDDLPLAHNLCS